MSCEGVQPRVQKLSDCHLSELPRCSGCSEELPPESKAERFGVCVIAHCEKCGYGNVLHLEG